MRRIYILLISGALLAGFIVGTGTHHRIERALTPVICAVQSRYYPTAKCDAKADQHKPPQIKRLIPTKTKSG